MSGVLYLSVPGPAGTPAATLAALAARLLGPCAQRLRVDDGTLSTVVAGGTVARRVFVPVHEADGFLRPRLRPRVHRFALGLVLRPWLRITQVVDYVSGEHAMRYRVTQRLGTRVDVALRPHEVDVDGLEADLIAAHPVAAVTRRDGTPAACADLGSGVLLVPRAEVRSPDSLYAAWSPPIPVDGPEEPPAGDV